MIDYLSLKFGPKPSSPPLSFPVTPVTIFVGPNYSGKSKIISEIHRRCIGAQGPVDVILNEIKFTEFDGDEAERRVDAVTQPILPEENLGGPDIVKIGTAADQITINRRSLIKLIVDANKPERTQHFASNFLRFHCLLLDGTSRIGLINDQAMGDLLKPAHTTLQALFRNDPLRKRLSELVFRAFNLHLVIDPTSGGALRLRLSKSPPPSVDIERGLTAESIEFHNAATHILETSDGAKAYTGVLTATLVGEPEILLMDEPEAFLHPKLAYMLGQEVAKSLSASSKKLFVSTHSSHFLMGCIQSGVPINVVRLTYRDGVPSARLLPSDELIGLMRNPLLRSTGVISALFFESAVVTEGDADRAFYDEVNERLLASSADRGVPNCIFLNAQGKDTIPTIIQPLRKLGIPAAAIYDIDFVKNDGKSAKRFLRSASVPMLSEDALTTMRASVLKALHATGKNFKLEGGINLLSESDQLAATSYLDQLSKYGVFVIGGGELESWLKGRVPVGGHGPNWLIAMFEELGSDPASLSYVRPDEGDIWAFLDNIRRWVLDPLRLGIPD